MNRLLHAVSPLEDTVEIPVIEGEVALDDTVEIPLLKLRPPAPCITRPRPAAPPSRFATLRRYGWLVGLVAAGLIVYAPILLRGLGASPPWIVLVAVAWVTVGVPLAFLIGLSIRDADEKAGLR